jgi:GDP-D-mannose dehydratase
LIFSKNNNLVFGANGQNGFLTCKYLLLRNEPVIAVLRKNSKFLILLYNLKKIHKKLLIEEVSDYTIANYNTIFSKYSISKIFFFAGYSKIPKNEKENETCYNSNFLILENLLKSIVDNKIRPKIVYLSSGEIYGHQHKSAKNENSLIIEDNYYSQTKIKAMNIINLFKKKESLFISNAICFNHDSYFSPKEHIIRVVINKFKNKKDLKFFNVENYRNFSHVYDFIPIYYKILNLKEPEDFILANNSNHQIIELINLIKNKLNFQKNCEIQFISNSSKYQVSRIADNSKIRKFFNYNPVYTLEKLINRMISYEKKSFYLN